MAFLVSPLLFKDDYRSRVERIQNRLRKTYYSVEPGDREAQITRLAHHYCPHTVVGVEDYKRSGESEVQLEFAFYPHSLESFIGQRGKLSPEEVTAVVVDLVETILSLHKEQITHQDLNISNVVMDFSCQHIRLIDFETSSAPGLKFRDCLSTIDSASPELLRDIDSRCTETDTDPYKNDLWALGKIVYDLVSGQRTRSMARLTSEQRGTRIREATMRYQEVRPVLETCLEGDIQLRGGSLQEALDRLRTKERRFPLKELVETGLYHIVGRGSVESGICPDIRQANN